MGIFKESLRKAGIPDMRFYDLRHTAATLMLKEGINPKIVQERLGHSDISMTLETCSHVLPSMQDEAADKLDELVTMVELGVEMPKAVQSAVFTIRFRVEIRGRQARESKITSMASIREE